MRYATMDVTAELSGEQLDLFAGVYNQGNGPSEIVLFGRHLRLESGQVLITIGPSRFAALDVKSGIEFILQNGEVTGYIE